IQHNQRRIEGCYTNKRLPVRLLYYESFQSPNDAIAREKQIKGWTRIKKEKLIKGEYGRFGISLVHM
ncbi:MAG: GIY-YIG nuclease family protein, partial [Bacteroidota bacterium]|nr:GIY-YIG nuclease family protein [Bacteroidota bacterium]MDX5431765.1 GIY-YIG nuclease family protein [Bacteroidota bacterium]MDX5470478.1 GIY-YIG nuclease family protein [Bacteroidota bacterium]